MTVIAGFWCTDGVIMGADNLMTFGPGNHPTITQPFPDKISLIKDRVITAYTGEIGLAQRVNDVIARVWSQENLSKKDELVVGQIIATKIRENIQETWIPSLPLSIGGLVALSCNKKHSLIEFASKNLQPEWKGKNNWYVAMGSGQTIADPLLGFFRSTFWKDGPPNVQDGILTMAMLLNLVCDMTPGGVGKPIHISTLTQDSNEKWVVKTLEENELQEHEENYKSVMDYFSDYKGKIQSSVSSINNLPDPPASVG